MVLPAVALAAEVRAIDASQASAAAVPTSGGRALLEQLLAVLATGDQAAYERFAQATYAPAALARSADSLLHVKLAIIQQ